MEKELIQLIDISKAFDGQMVLDELNLNIHENEFVTLLGPSAAAKRPRCAFSADSPVPIKGGLSLTGRTITQLPPNKRQLNTVFQKYALFTHMTIAENIASG